MVIIPLYRWVTWGQVDGLTCAPSLVSGRQNQEGVGLQLSGVYSEFFPSFVFHMSSIFLRWHLGTNLTSWADWCPSLSEGSCRHQVNGPNLGGIPSSWWPISAHQQIDGNCKPCWDASGCFNKYGAGFYKHVCAIFSESTDTEIVSHRTELLRSDFQLSENCYSVLFFFLTYHKWLFLKSLSLS